MPEGAEVYSFTEGVVSPMVDPEACYKQVCDWVKGHVHANEKVGSAVSGGIDSNVVEQILRDSIGENLYTIHMDHGFMRLINGKEESDIVAKTFSDYPNFIYRKDVRDRFYKAVEGIENGDKKRAAFRDVYKEVLHETMEPFDCIWTADGTIAPDIRETRGGIKLQHNVDLGFAQKKLEPLAALSKQEVRVLAKYMGIPHLRQPFPGPGLLIRTVGKYSPEKLAVEKKANDIVDQEYMKYMIERHGTEMLIDPETGMQTPFQTFAATFDYKCHGKIKKVLTEHGIIRPKLNTKVTGLVDDGKKYKRIYKKPVIFDYRMANHFYQNKEVIFDSVHLGHGKAAYFEDDRKDEEILNGVKAELKRMHLHRILYPLDKRDTGDFSVVIRAVDSIDVKTVMPNTSGMTPMTISERILKEIPGVNAVFFDITPKPPATVEYE